MLNVEFIRKNPRQVEKGLISRGVDKSSIKQLLDLDKTWRSELQKVEQLRSKRNQAAKKRDANLGKKLKTELDTSEARLSNIKNKLGQELSKLPNLPLPEVPVGDPSKVKVLDEFGQPPDFDFEPRNHLQLGEMLEIIDIQTAAKVSGSRFAYLKNEAVFLELALVNFAFERLNQNGFQAVLPPTLIKKDITEKLGYWQAGGNDNFYLVSDFQKEKESDKEEANPLYLIGTAEHALVPMLQDRVLSVDKMPHRLVGFSPSYRRESGTYGKDTQGIIRVHQFDKVEMVSFVHPSQAEEEFETMLGLSWQMMQDLELPIRQVILPSEDMGLPAAKTVDIETWFPSQQKFRETHSISTTTDYQSRNFNIRFEDKGKKDFVHILNGTAFAIQRLLSAILENYQRRDGSVDVPKALRPYTGFSKIEVR